MYFSWSLYGFLFHIFTLSHLLLCLYFPHTTPVQQRHSPPSTFFSFPSCMSWLHLLFFLFLFCLYASLSLLILSYLCLIWVLRFMSYLELVLRCPDFIFIFDILWTCESLVSSTHKTYLFIPYLCKVRLYIQIAVSSLKYLTPKDHKPCWSKF